MFFQTSCCEEEPPSAQISQRPTLPYPQLIFPARFPLHLKNAKKPGIGYHFYEIPIIWGTRMRKQFWMSLLKFCFQLSGPCEYAILQKTNFCPLPLLVVFAQRGRGGKKRFSIVLSVLPIPLLPPCEYITSSYRCSLFVARYNTVWHGHFARGHSRIKCLQHNCRQECLHYTSLLVNILHRHIVVS